jgi:hypothetical protein
MSLRERQPYMEESERLKHLHARQFPTYKVIIRLHFTLNMITNQYTFTLTMMFLRTGNAFSISRVKE